MTKQIITLLLVSGVTVVGAFAHGTVKGRWQPIAPSNDYALPAIPAVIAGWRSEDLKSSLDGDHVLRNLTRKYTHPQSGRALTVSLTVGPAGLTAQHTPEYCYPGSGFEAVGQTQTLNAGTAEFRSAVYRKKAGDALRILWAWSPDGAWSAPQYPEMKFFRGALYKLYVVSWNADRPPEQDSELQDFLTHLLTTLEQCLFQPANPPAPRAAVKHEPPDFPLSPPSTGGAGVVAAWYLPFPGMPGTRITWSRMKRVWDVVASLAILIATAPALLMACALVKLTSRGPAIYAQRRLGWFGREFTIYKVRSMRLDAEASGGPRWCVPGDPRVTLVGRVLRKLHVDELPQLWNVIKGDMSLVGPRPERPEFMPKIRPFVPGYDGRHAVRPGITGLAQVQVDADTEVGNVARKLKYDLYYVRHQGPWLETTIYAYTLLKVVGVPLSTLRRWLGLGLEREEDSARRAA